MVRWSLALIFIVFTSLPVVAQTSAYLFLGGPKMVGYEKYDLESRFLSVDPDARRVLAEAVWPAGTTATDRYITPDGALMVVRNGAELTLRNLATSALSTLTLPFTPRFFFGSPTRPEIYMDDGLGFVALSASGFRRVSSRQCPPSILAPQASLSADGRRLAIVCPPAGPFLGAVVDTASGEEIKTLAGSSGYYPFTLSRDGDEFYAVAGGTAELRRYSVATEAVLAEVAFPYGRATLAVDPHTRRLFAELPDNCLLRVFDPMTLQPLSSVTFCGAAQMSFEPHRPRAYRMISRSIPSIPGGPSLFEANFQIIKTDTLEPPLAFALALYAISANLGVVVAPRPSAPAGLAANVAGSTVQLSWAAGPPPGAAMRFVLEAGSGPGLANLATFDVGLQTRLVVNGVPPGTYYVRVRPANATGSGQPSNEIVVIVP
jgi:hypothetical protein